MGNPEGKGGFQKGHDARRNAGGMTKEQREARDKLRSALAGDADEVHAALMQLVKERNQPAVIYAHQVLHGKEPLAVDMEHSGIGDNPARPLTTEDLLAIAKSAEPKPGP